MPRLIDVPNVGQVEFPDDMSDAQIAQAVQNTMQPKPRAPEGSNVGDFFTGAGHGAMDLGRGLKQYGLGAGEAVGLFKPGTQGEYTKRTDAANAEYNKTSAGQSTAGQIGNFVGGMAPLLMVPGGIYGALGKRMLTGAISGGLIGNITYVPEGGSRGINTAAGGLLGGAAPAVMAPLAKGYNAITGKGLEPDAQGVVDAGKKWGVRVGAADVSNNGLLKSIDQGLEELLLIGTRGFREAQNTEAKSAAQSALMQSYDNITNTPFEGLEQVRAIAQSGGPRAAKAQSILDAVGNAGDDWNRIIETSGNLSVFNKKLAADQKYQLVQELADKHGAVPLNESLAAIQSMATREAGAVLPEKELIGTLNILAKNLGKGDLSYSQLRQARSDIGAIINDSYQAFHGRDAVVGSRGAAALQSVKDAITKDMDAFATQRSPELQKAWQDADTYYRTQVAPYKDVQLAKALTNAAPDEIYGKFITSGGIEGSKGTSRAARLYNALDPKGREAVKYGMVRNAVEHASQPDTGAFSPAKFATSLDKIAAAKGVFFKGSDKAEIDGLKNLMRHVERSNVAINKPETGVRALPYLVGGAAAGGAYFNPVAAASAGVGAYGIRKLMTTAAGRNFLLSASKIKAGSPAMQRHVDTMMKASQLGLLKGGLDASRDSTTAAPDPSSTQDDTYDAYLQELQQRGAQ